ncbi:MAG: nicotinate-nucleotide pyrophosphorylase (carboxylating) [Granulosicoccus sp.]|jgi:nicotinate-nucleotide pyrophosphorylase (carboxylating)
MTIDEIIDRTLEEDLGDGDHTSNACLPSSVSGSAYLVCKEAGVIAGMDLAETIFHRVDDNLIFKALVSDGESIEVGQRLFEVEGSSRSILTAERTVLNFMQRMSGIATKTRFLNSLIGNNSAKLLDTRKTTPLLREIEKLAVRIGGGYNHRMGLYDMIMIKDNHADMSGGITAAVTKVHKYMAAKGKKLKVEVEVRDLEELNEVLSIEGVDRVMLDNFTPTLMTEAVNIIAGRIETEASGGITEATIADYAATGVDYISVGALTHNIQSLDLSLKAD